MLFQKRNKKTLNTKSEAGQSLIETLVAIFVLVTGLISAISLAIASFNATDNTNKQIVGTALAREAIEGVRNLRDQYWLQDTLTICEDLGSGQECYQNWRGPVASKTLVTGTYNLDYNTNSSQWVLRSSPPTFVLNFDSSTGLYSSQGVGTASSYSRKVEIAETTTAPYTIANPRLTITSTVWWRSRNCPAAADPASVTGNCKVILQAYLTNWRNY